MNSYFQNNTRNLSPFKYLAALKITLSVFVFVATMFFMVNRVAAEERGAEPFARLGEASAQGTITSHQSYSIPLCASSQPYRNWNNEYVERISITNYFEGHWHEFKTQPGICKKLTYKGTHHGLVEYRIVEFKLDGQVVRKVKFKMCSGCGRIWGG